jgi:hypothetical protein
MFPDAGSTPAASTIIYIVISNSYNFHFLRIFLPNLCQVTPISLIFLYLNLAVVPKIWTMC